LQLFYCFISSRYIIISIRDSIRRIEFLLGLFGLSRAMPASARVTCRNYTKLVILRDPDIVFSKPPFRVRSQLLAQSVTLLHHGTSTSRIVNRKRYARAAARRSYAGSCCKSSKQTDRSGRDVRSGGRCLRSSPPIFPFLSSPREMFFRASRFDGREKRNANAITVAHRGSTFD
jgi:hypothetical protein